MSDGPLHFTMRELQRMFFAPRFWVLIAGAAFLLGLTGPFGTYDGLRMPAQFAYWGATVVATYFVGGAAVFLFVETVWPGRERGPGHYALAGAVSGLPVAAVVWALNVAVFGYLGGINFLPLLAYCVAIAGLVSLLVATFTRQYDRAREGTSAPLTERRPRILDRLPPNLRGRLSHLSVQDHYVDVRTDKGGTLVLMRLADAIAETEGVAGLQIHRSHWVALEADREGRPPRRPAIAQDAGRDGASGEPDVCAGCSGGGARLSLLDGLSLAAAISSSQVGLPQVSCL